MTPSATESRNGSRLPRVALIIALVILTLPGLGIGFVIGFDYLTYRRVRSVLSGRSTSVPVSMRMSVGLRSLLVTDPAILLEIASAGASKQNWYAHETSLGYYETTFDFGSGSTYPVSVEVHADGRGLCFVVPRGPGLDALNVFNDPYFFDMRLDYEDDSRLSEMMRFLMDIDRPGSLHLSADVTPQP